MSRLKYSENNVLTVHIEPDRPRWVLLHVNARNRWPAGPAIYPLPPAADRPRTQGDLTPVVKDEFDACRGHDSSRARQGFNTATMAR